MSLTAAQLQSLKASIAADATLSTLPQTADASQQIADAYNALAVSDYYVWRTNVTEAEYVGTSGVDVANGNAATNWSWTGTGFITRAQGERDAWNRLFVSGFANPSLANVRQAFLDILSGNTAPAPANRNHLTVLSKRKATRAEKLFATGTGSFAAPATMAVEGQLTATDVLNAWNS
jgi:hypothetical protein